MQRLLDAGTIRIVGEGPRPNLAELLQEADAKGLDGEAREAFRSQCEFAKAKAQ